MLVDLQPKIPEDLTMLVDSPPKIPEDLTMLVDLQPKMPEDLTMLVDSQPKMPEDLTDPSGLTGQDVDLAESQWPVAQGPDVEPGDPRWLGQVVADPRVPGPHQVGL